jgi:hypothetical protein
VGYVKAVSGVAPNGWEDSAPSPSIAQQRRDQIREFLSRERDWSEPQPDVLAGPALIPKPCGGSHLFELRVELGANFPGRASKPIVRVLKHDVPAKLDVDFHVVRGEELCLEVAGSGDIDYERGGLQELMGQVAVHLHRIVIRAYSGEWPGPARSHDVEGLLEVERESLVAGLQPYADPSVPIPPTHARCPCGSKKRFDACCRARIQKVRTRIRAYRRLTNRPPWTRR